MSAIYYADSSALVKRHIPETGSAWIEREFNAASRNTVISAKITVIEVLSAKTSRKIFASGG